MKKEIVDYKEEDLIDHHGVSAIIKDKKGKILMQKHVKYGFWTVPVGKVKLKQDIQSGLKEEIFEECDIKISEMKEIGKSTDIYNRNGKKVKVFMHLFEILKYSREIKNKEPEKHEIQEFKSIDEIKRLPYLSDATLFYLQKLGFERADVLE